MVKLIKTATEFELSPTLATNELVVQRRKEGKEVLHMGFGQSPFPVVPRLAQALREHSTENKYLPTAGLQELREAVYSYYEHNTNIDMQQFDIVIAPGSKLILYALQMAIEGDLLMTVPSWVSYAPQARMLHTNVLKVPVILDDEGYHIHPEGLRQVISAARSEGKNPSKLIINYPNNPTGMSITEEELKAIAQVCIDEDILIISDEIYGFNSFDGNYRSIAQFAPSHTAVSSGLSKHISLGGWRIGIGFIPKSVSGLFQLICNIASETWSSVPSPVQYAVVEAYKGHDDVETFVRQSTDIHHLMNTYIAKGLRELGINVAIPQGGFYVYPDFSPYRAELMAVGVNTSKQLAAHLMEKYGIAVLPGVAFGAETQDLTLRLSGCDYEGAKALEAYGSGVALDENFITTYAPNIKRAVEVYGEFIESIRSAYAKGQERVAVAE